MEFIVFLAMIAAPFSVAVLIYAAFYPEEW